MSDDSGSDRDSSPDFEAMRARASGKRNLLLGGVGAVALLGLGFAVVNARQSARLEAEAAAAALRGCVLGAPLEARETAWQRFRRLQLPALARSDIERGTLGAKLWPLSCRNAAGKVQDVFKNDLTEAELGSLAKLIKFLSETSAASKDATEALEPTLALLDKQLPGPVPPGKEPLPERVLNLDGLASIKPLSKKGTALGRSYTEDNPGLSLPVLVDEESMSAPLLCVFQNAAADTRCRSLTELASVHGHGLRLLGTSDATSPTLIFAGKRGSEGVFVAGSPAPLDRLYSYGGYASANGKAWVLGWDEAARGLVLVHKAPEQAAARTPLNPNFRVGNFFYGSQLLWDQVLVRGITPDNERRLFALPVSKPDAGSFEPVDIGELPEPGLIRQGDEEQPHLTGCRTDQATVVRVRGSRQDFITFRIGSAFSQPVPSPTWGVLGCHGATATLVTAGFSAGGTRLYHSACTSAGCNTSELKGEALDRNSGDLRPQDARDVQAVDLGGKLLAVWLGGERGGLRMRMAAPELFEREPDKLLFDDHVANGKNAQASTLLGFRLYSRERFAVLLLSSMAGVHAFRIDPDGKVSPFEVSGVD
jgi:hypothetical protein